MRRAVGTPLRQGRRDGAGLLLLPPVERALLSGQRADLALEPAVTTGLA